MTAFVVAPHNICNIGSKLLNAWTEQVGTSPLTFTLRAPRFMCLAPIEMSIDFRNVRCNLQLDFNLLCKILATYVKLH